ncbi:putative metal-binding protein [Inhella inkyongensis]|uniref:Putative metal-binding protein n=1 Tax=Inhella inkyongensis TaxID=392593 RepID=A0A840S871_9BURK|nr:putative zinc-binding protein [Inhella inkyongensis]MBB5204994.1 putative metal-binding protein [Inhella inkyongensis]
MQTPLPLVYACSGCSSAAQLANHLAVRLDRAGDAEMSCIAGVGGGVKPLVRTAQRAAQTGRAILAIDGCALACVQASLLQVEVRPSLTLGLHELGVRKLQHQDFDPAQAEELLQHCRALLGVA